MSKNIIVLKKIIYTSLQDQFTNKNTNGTWSNILVGLPHYWNSDPYHTQQVMMEDTAPGTHTWVVVSEKSVFDKNLGWNLGFEFWG